MTDFNDPHVPTPEFRASLKRELQRSYRAELQFDAAHVGRARRVGVIIGMAAGGVMTLTIGLVLGAATGFASAENLGARQRDAAGVIDTTPPSGLDMLKAPIRNAITALTCASSSASAQAPKAQQGIPIVGVTKVSAKTPTTLGAVLGVRELPDGRLLVNDAGRRQVKIFDPAFARETVAQDSAAGTSNSYFPRPAYIARYLGDSTLFMDIAGREYLVLDRNGQVARAIAPPTYEERGFVAVGVAPFPVPFPMPRAVDHAGRLVAQAGFNVRNGLVADSALVLRADLDTRQVDVVGAYHSGSSAKNRSEPPEDGKRVVTTIRQPVPTEDSWAVLSDGTIAFVRGQDYHVDWILPDGTKSATTKLPFDWKRLTDEEKQHLMDSAKVVWDSMMVIRNARNAGTPPMPRDGEPQRGGGRSNGGGAAPGQQGSIQRMMSVPLSEIPDYYPPIRESSAMPDLDGNLWILPTTSAQSQKGELVYDVVNPKLGLFRRVRMPIGRSVVGFGKGGVVYLQSGDRTSGFYLERVKLDVAK